MGLICVLFISSHSFAFYCRLCHWSTYINLLESNDATSGREVYVDYAHIEPGDVYALTGPALNLYYHSIGPDSLCRGTRYVLTLRTTNVYLEHEHVAESKDAKAKGL